ncbi:hypothetical protein [Planotetraspora silvatica]|nr:hypothetical protein [Planotetraspora silvatica]
MEHEQIFGAPSSDGRDGTRADHRISPSKMDGFAVASLVLGLCGLLWFPGLLIARYVDERVVDLIRPVVRLMSQLLFCAVPLGLSLLGISTGHVARHRLRWAEGRGNAIAVAGLWAGYLALVCLVLLVAGSLWLASQFS